MAESTPTTPTSAAGAVSIEEFCELANNFIELDRLTDAIEVYERACRIYPDSIALKINLGRVRNLTKVREEEEAKQLETRFAKHRRQKDSLAVQFNSVAETYMLYGGDRAYEVDGIRVIPVAEAMVRADELLGK